MPIKPFTLAAPFSPAGDQPQAIDALVSGITHNQQHQVLLGVTGSGKTFTMANVLAQLNMPTLVISPNKTLAAQLYLEFKHFFPNNPVEYFISYYDYYQPEAYIPHTDTYIEKDASINAHIEKLRLKATASLLEEKNCIVVASVSCIYGLGSPEDYEGMIVQLAKGDAVSRDQCVRKLVAIQYERNEMSFVQGALRIKGDTVDVFPAYLDHAVRITFDDARVSDITIFNPLTGEFLHRNNAITVYPAKHFVISEGKRDRAIVSILDELKVRLDELQRENKMLEAHRLQQRTEYDMEMLREIGYCNGIENYSRHLTGRAPGQPPFCLIDYFPKPFLTMIDESHVTVSQVRAMYNGDRARKQVLVDYGFRLPSAYDNRPLRFDEFETMVGPVVYVSATPGDYELQKSQGTVVEQIIRPTGLVDPNVDVRPTKNMIKDVFSEIKTVVARKERVLITTLTKRLAEDLAQYLEENLFRARYMHSDIDALERVKIITEFRQGKFDCLIGINLLREGLDLPEVSLVVIMDADKEGFLRSERSLIQTAGRAARNVNGKIIMYADTTTGSMQRAMSEMNRRRKKQVAYNTKHNITPTTILKNIDDELVVKEEITNEKYVLSEEAAEYGKSKKEIIALLEKEMRAAAESWDFERAIIVRERLKKVKNV